MNLIRLVFISLLFCSAAQAEQPSLLHDFTGKPADLATHTAKGKWTIVMIWAHDCLVCNQEAAAYMDFHRRNANTTAEVIGISMDGRENLSLAQSFTRRHKLTFENYIAEPVPISNWFFEQTGATWRGTPTFLVYSPKGELLAQQAGAIPVPLLEQFIQNDGKF